MTFSLTENQYFFLFLNGNNREWIPLLNCINHVLSNGFLSFLFFFSLYIYIYYFFNGGKGCVLGGFPPPPLSPFADCLSHSSVCAFQKSVKSLLRTICILINCLILFDLVAWATNPGFIVGTELFHKQQQFCHQAWGGHTACCCCGALGLGRACSCW